MDDAYLLMYSRQRTVIVEDADLHILNIVLILAIAVYAILDPDMQLRQ